jgi:hypothetical protein
MFVTLLEGKIWVHLWQFLARKVPVWIGRQVMPWIRQIISCFENVINLGKAAITS